MNGASPWSSGKNNYEKYLEKITDTVRDYYRKARLVKKIIIYFKVSSLNENDSIRKKRSFLGR